MNKKMPENNVINSQKNANQIDINCQKNKTKKTLIPSTRSSNISLAKWKT